jgi:tRNA threonylcarbamoyladenosine biosynthesis protein TsaB
VYLFGNGADKFKEIFKDNNSINFIDDITCSAKGMVSLSEQKFMDNDFEDAAYFEPNYGKEFYTTAKV